ncbi:MAG: major capsid protein [Alloalcanivorax sp.]
MDFTGVDTAITDALTDLSPIGLAIVTVIAGIWAFKQVRSMIGR